ncbi:unnamed protein product, partial [Cladocopium goreaui]
AYGAISGELLVTLRLPATAPLSELRRAVAAALLPAPADARFIVEVKLFHDGLPLNGATLVDAGLRTGAEIQVIICNSQQLLAGAVDGTGSIWDLEGPTKVHGFHHGAELHSAAVSPDGKFLGTAGADGQVILWQREPLDVEFNLQGHQGQVYPIRFCPVSSSLFSASGDATARLWDICSGQELLCLRGHRRDVNACAVSPDGHVLATGSDDYCFATWDRRTGQQLQHWDGRRGEGHSGRVYAVAFEGTGRYLATGAVDKKAKIWDLRKGGPGGRCLHAFSHTDLVNSVEFSADGKLVASASDDAFVHVWKAEDATLVASHQHPMPVMCATFSEDGGLASGCSDGHLRFWKDTEQVVGLGEETSTTLTCRAAVKSVSFIPL